MAFAKSARRSSWLMFFVLLVLILVYLAFTSKSDNTLHANLARSPTLTIPKMKPAAPRAPVVKCRQPVLVIGARGTNAEPGYGSLGKLAKLVKRKLPRARIEALAYPATKGNPGPPYFTSVSMGAAALQKLIVDAVQECPAVRIALMGYSQGANVVTDALCGSSETSWSSTVALGSQYASSIMTVVLMGDPTHYVEQTFVQGTANKSGLFPRVEGFQCAPYTAKIVSYCDMDDPICAGGANETVHHTYAEKYSDVAAKWMVSMLRRARMTT